MGLTERLHCLDEVIVWKGEIPLQSRYTMGLAGERFFREIKDNTRLMATRCPQCDYTYLPPRAYCERCFAELTEWTEVPPRGTVYAYTVVHQDLDEQPLDKPRLVALIEIEGCDSLFVHCLGEVETEEVYIGMPVEAVFQEKRQGLITDIAYFRPL